MNDMARCKQVLTGGDECLDHGDGNGGCHRNGDCIYRVPGEATEIDTLSPIPLATVMADTESVLAAVRKELRVALETAEELDAIIDAKDKAYAELVKCSRESLLKITRWVGGDSVIDKFAREGISKINALANINAGKGGA